MEWRSAITLSIALILIAARPAASASGSWTSVPSMADLRVLHTATLLDDGDVVVAGGGCIGKFFVRGTEVYRRATATWDRVGDMSVPRCEHTATLVAGKVLVAGGITGFHSGSFVAAASAELYDPATGTWSSTGAMTTARAAHTATLLSSGKVLVTSGSAPGSSSVPLATAELYDPTTGLWTATPNNPGRRIGHTATLLRSGKVLVAGGLDAPRFLRSAVLYDPATGAWSGTGLMTIGRTFHDATLLPSGKVLVVGGDSGLGPIASAEIYDPASGTWTPTAPMSVARQVPKATLLRSGRVLVAGGEAHPGFGLASAELYDPSSGTWTPTGPMNVGRVYHTATPLLSGDVLVTGGEDVGAISDTSPFGALASAELYSEIVDALPPITTASVSPAPNAAGWNATSVTVTLTATDDLSGVASTTASLDGAPVGMTTAVTSEGIHLLSYYSTDVAGNVEASHMLTLRIDRTSPVVVYSGNASSYSVDQAIDVRCSASDPASADGTAGSGVESTTCQDISGPAYAFNVGTNTYSASATDRAGNVGSGSTTFTVVVTVDGLSELIGRFVTNAGVAKALQAQVASIASAPNANAASGKLAAFADLINAQIGKSLTSDQATILLELVKAL